MNYCKYNSSSKSPFWFFSAELWFFEPLPWKMTANSIRRILQAETRRVRSKLVPTASRAWCCLIYARPSGWVKACSLGSSQEKLRNLLKVCCNSHGSGKEAMWINSRVSVDAMQVSDDCELLAAATLREMKQSCKGWGGNWRASPRNLSFSTSDHACSEAPLMFS